MKLLLVDDHPLFAVCFSHALTQGGAGIDVDTAATIDSGLSRAAWGSHDMVLIDQRLAGTGGIEGIRRFGAHYPLMARVLISGDEDAALVARAKSAGANGFLGKSQSIDQLRAALQSIGRGEPVSGFHPPSLAAQASASPTKRQLQVLALLAQGQPNKRIASALGIAERTVKLHITALLQALGARNRTHLLIVGRDMGLL
jgi:DNA-binding NarL/FixJ family response regulator